MKRLVLLLVLLSLALALGGWKWEGSADAAPTAKHAKHARQHHPLRYGDKGQRVKDIQWLLSGHKPSVYKLRTYTDQIDGEYGPKTLAAVKGMKWRLGYPSKAVSGRAGKQLFLILVGRVPRPLGWVGRASKRLGDTQHKVITGKSPCARRIVRLAESQIGVHEVPDGSNSGARVRVYQAVTRAFYAPWCASFVQWVVLHATGHTVAAPLPALVFSIVSYAHSRAWLHALPRPGALVGYLHSLGHIGIVERVAQGGFYAIEGNAGNAVRRVYHSLGDRQTVFIWLPGCS